MPPPVTQSSLAQKLGLSRSTVAAALNKRSTIQLRPETRKKILRAAEKLEYRPHRYAQILRSGPSRLIGIVHSGGLLQSASERAYHCAQGLHRAGLDLLACDVSWFPDGLESAVKTLLEARVEGVVFAGLQDADAASQLAPLMKAGVPMVNLSGNELRDVPQVRGDARAAVRGLTNHLLSRGHSHVVLLVASAGQDVRGSYGWARQERIDGFSDAILGKGGTIRLAQVQARSRSRVAGEIFQQDVDPEPFDPFLPGRLAMEQLLRAGSLPDAVVCSNDDWAVGAIYAITQAGLRVPEDLAVTGFDNTAAGSYLTVPLTTAAQPSAAIAKRGVEILLKQLSGRRLRPSERLVRLKCPLLFRASSGSPRQKTKSARTLVARA